MLLNYQAGFKGKRLDLEKLKPITNVSQILIARQQVQEIQTDEKIIDYLLNLIERSRQHPDLILGASPRSAVSWLQTAKANAWLQERNYITPDDIKQVALPLLRHRLILRPEAILDGLKIESVISSLLNQVSVPR